MVLLAPKVGGPLSPLITSIHVELLLPGGVVEVFVNGVSINRSGIAGTNSVDIPLLGYSLPPGGKVTAKWSLAGDVSPASLPEVVLGYTDNLPHPVVLTPVHTAADWIAVGGLFPGATVEIYNGPNLVGGPQASDGVSAQVRINGNVGPGDRLEVVQTVLKPDGTTSRSPSTESLPAEEWYPREEQLPTPAVIAPIIECAGAVLVGGTVPGCFLHLHIDGSEHEYSAISETFWAVLPGPATKSETFAALNHLHRLNRASGQSASVPVDPAATMRTPTLMPDTQYCPRAVSVTAGSLVPGSEVRVELRGASGTATLGRGGAPDGSTTASYWLGDLSTQVPQGPPFPALVLTERLCAQNTESNRAWIHRRSEPEVPPGFFLKPTDCSHWLHVVNVWGFVVTVRSNQADWPILAHWTIVPQDGWIYLNRALRYGEYIWVEVEQGCIPDHLRVSDQAMVESAGDVDAVRISEPVRPGKNRKIWVENAIRGGRLHVFVSGKWRVSTWVTGESTSTLTEVYVGELNEEDSVTVRMEHCGRVGDPSPKVWVRRGQLSLDVEPRTVTREQTVLLTIWARDADYGFEMGSLVIKGLGGHVGYTGTAFTVTTTAGTASPLHFTVDAEGYDQGIVDVPITAPAPPPSGILTIKTMSAVGLDPANQIIKEIEWTLSGVGQPVTRSETPYANSTVVSIPLPAPGAQVTYVLSGKATIELKQATITTETVTAFSVWNGTQSSIVVDWNGSPRTAEINISFRHLYDLQTGAIVDTIFLFVLNSIT